MIWNLHANRNNGLPIVECFIAQDSSVWNASVPPPRLKIRALIDTGASHVLATPRVIQSLGLPYIADFNNSVVGATVVNRSYRGEVIFSGTPAAPGGPLESNVTGLAILESQLSGYDAIIGWDVLQFYRFSFEKSGAFTLTYHN
jgi:hypothetical protein